MADGGDEVEPRSLEVMEIPEPEDPKPPQPMPRHYVVSKEQKRKIGVSVGVRPRILLRLDVALDKFLTERVREMFIYLFFVLLFTYVTLGQRSIPEMSEIVSGFRSDQVGAAFPERIQAFTDGTSEADFWMFMQKVLPGILMPDQDYSGRPKTPSERNYLRKYNVVTGVPLLRQKRVRGRPCDVVPRLRPAFAGVRCHPKYRNRDEETGETFIGVNYTTGKKTGMNSISGYTKVKYNGGGYVWRLDRNQSQSDFEGFIADLKAARFTDDATRLVTIDFASYNAVSDVFIAVRFVAEFMPYGNVRPSAFVRAFRMGFTRAKDWAYLVVEVVMYMFVIGYSIGELVRVKNLRLLYLSDPFNILNLVNFGIFFVVLVLKCQFISLGLPLINKVERPNDLDLDYQHLALLFNNISNWNAFNSILVWLKTFMYLKYLNRKVAEMTNTLYNITNDLITFTSMLLLIFWAYTQAFHIALGIDVAEFRTTTTTFFMLLRTILGEFIFQDVYDANRFLGPVLFISYVVAILMVLMNMFMAIMNSEYDRVTADPALGDDPIAIVFRRSVKKKLFDFAGSLKRMTPAVIRRLLFGHQQVRAVGPIVFEDAELLSGVTQGEMEDVQADVAALKAASKLVVQRLEAMRSGREQPPEAKADMLAPGWREKIDAKGRTYYYHAVTRETTWKRPRLLSFNAAIEPAAAAPPQAFHAGSRI